MHEKTNDDVFLQYEAVSLCYDEENDRSDHMNTFEKARQFVYRNARPLDLARWQFHFENGSREAVLHGLSFYQNEDGGFGHGLESDFLNPNSTPISTWAATEILREIQFSDRNHPIVQGILRYLESGADFDAEQGQWLNTVPTNNDYPHAVWWAFKGKSDFQYNPTAALAGFIIRFADHNTAIYQKACEIARQAIEWFTAKVPFEEQHITACFLALFDALVQDKTDIADMVRFEEKLREQVRCNICRDTEKWATAYVPKPSDFGIWPGSIFYEDNRELAEYECEHIKTRQLPDGGFPVTWQWYNGYKEFEVAANHWQVHFAITNMLYLRAHGHI